MCYYSSLNAFQFPILVEDTVCFDLEDVFDAIGRISTELSELEEKRNHLLMKKGDLGIQEANLHTLLKLVERILMREGQTELLKTGTDDVPITNPACYDLVDFYERTDEITQWGPVTEYDNEMVQRFVEKIVVLDDGLEIRFKAGISVKK